MASLALGASGSDVRRLQSALAEAGFYSGSVDGKFGASTKAAVEAYQKENGLKVDGKVGEKTWAELEADGFEDGSQQAPQASGDDSFQSAPAKPGQGTGAGALADMATVAEGAEGVAVKLLQQALTAKGFPVAKLDGKFGAGTEAAVKRFQQAQGMEADGKVGKQTAAALGLGADFAAASQKLSGASVGGTQSVGGDTGSSSTHIVAKMDRYPNGKGLTTGSITLNGHTYRFNSGKNIYFSTVKGEYRVTRQGGLSDSRGGTAFTRNGVGFSFIIEDAKRPGTDRMYDRRAGRDRQYLRIHPDGGSAGTQGCIGLTGSAAELKRFRADLNAAIRANGGSIRLTVG